MINQQLLDYIKQQLQQGIGKEQIKNSLMSGGWLVSDVEEGFNAIAPQPAPIPRTPSSFSNIQPVQPFQPIQPIQSISNFINPVASQNLQSQTEITQAVNSPKSVHKSKKIFFIIFILILLGAMGGVVYAYYTGAFVSLPGLVSESIDSSRAATSATYDTTITLDFSGVQSFTNSLNQLAGGVSSGKATLTTKGSYDFSDTNNKKISSVFSFDLGTLSLAAEIRVLDNTLYGVLTKAPTIAFFPTLSSVENKWFSIPYKSDNGQPLGNPLTSITGTSSNILDKLTADQKEHIYEMFRDAHFVKTVQRLSPEMVGGELSYNFTFDLDRDGINIYLQTLKSYINTIGNNDSALSAFDPTSLNKSLDQIKDFAGEIWIGRNDKLLHKIMLNFGIQPDATKTDQVKIGIVGIFSDWNQPVSITAPEGSIPFQTLISNLMPKPTAPQTLPKKSTK